MNEPKPILIEVITDKLGNDHFFEGINEPGNDAEILRELMQ